MTKLDSILDDDEDIAECIIYSKHDNILRVGYFPKAKLKNGKVVGRDLYFDHEEKAISMTRLWKVLYETQRLSRK